MTENIKYLLVIAVAAIALIVFFFLIREKNFQQVFINFQHTEKGKNTQQTAKTGIP